MIIVKEVKTGGYTVTITGQDIKDLAKVAKAAKRPRERIVAGCLRFGIAFLLYCLED